MFCCSSWISNTWNSFDKHLSPDNELIEKSAKYNIKGFTPKAELTNGRLAMLGFVALLLSGAFMAN